MGFLDKLKGMFSKGQKTASDLGAKAQDVAQDHATTINNTLNTVTDKIPGTVDDNLAAKAQDALGIAPAPAAPAPAPAPSPVPASAAPAPAPTQTPSAPTPGATPPVAQ